SREVAARAEVSARSVDEDGAQPGSKRPRAAPLESAHLAEDDEEHLLNQVVGIDRRNPRPRHPGAEQGLIEVQQPPPVVLVGPAGETLQQADGGFHERGSASQGFSGLARSARTDVSPRSVQEQVMASTETTVCEPRCLLSVSERSVRMR